MNTKDRKSRPKRITQSKRRIRSDEAKRLRKLDIRAKKDGKNTSWL
jgi:hypothetical protein